MWWARMNKFASPAGDEIGMVISRALQTPGQLRRRTQRLQVSSCQKVMNLG